MIQNLKKTQEILVHKRVLHIKYIQPEHSSQEWDTNCQLKRQYDSKQWNQEKYPVVWIYSYNSFSIVEQRKLNFFAKCFSAQT